MAEAAHRVMDEFNRSKNSGIHLLCRRNAPSLILFCFENDLRGELEPKEHRLI